MLHVTASESVFGAVSSNWPNQCFVSMHWIQGWLAKCFSGVFTFSRRSWTLAYNMGVPHRKGVQILVGQKRTNAHHRIWGDRVSIARENGAMFYDQRNGGNALFPSFSPLPQPHSLPSPHLNLYILQATSLFSLKSIYMECQWEVMASG